MAKQTIEIDVPEGKEIDWDLINENNQEDPLTIFVIYFKDKDKENETTN